MASMMVTARVNVEIVVQSGGGDEVVVDYVKQARTHINRVLC